MWFTHVKLENWRNFLKVDVPLLPRVFMVGPNASGKSNLLDALRFLRDIAAPEGGFQRAVALRTNVSQIRSLHARRYPNVAIEVEVELDEDRWSYRLEFTQTNQRVPVVAREIVRHGSTMVRERPDAEDDADPTRLRQTHLEQVNANKPFRSLADFLSDVRYLHLVPQLVREPGRSVGRERDPFGGDFLKQVFGTPKKVRSSRLRRIQEALRVAVPQLKELEPYRDEATGAPHLKGRYEHWRPNAGWQTEEQLSDGTLRLLGLLWALLDGSGPLLLEEPELSLHSGVVRHVPQMIQRLRRSSGRQVLLSTHSYDLLSDSGIAPEEVLLLQPTKESTEVRVAADDQQVLALLESGVPMAEVVLPRTAPRRASQLALFGE